MHVPLPRPVRTLLLAGLATLAASLGACSETPDETPEMPPPAVSVVTLAPERVALTRELPGRTRALLIAEVRPLVTGIIRERLYDEGSHVEAGQPLYQLDDATYRTAFRSAEASLARAVASLDIARLNAGRAEELIKTNAISDQEYRNLQATQREVEADVGVANAQLESARVRLSYARIRSPIEGRAGISAVTVGALVTADQAAPLTTVQQLDPIYVDVTQSASELLALRQQLSDTALQQADEIPVQIVLDDGSVYTHQGILTFEDAAVDPTTGSVAMRIVVPNPDLLMLPGMYVRAQIGNAVLDEALLVPQQGIARDPKGQAFAMLLNEENLVEQRSVEVRQTIGDKWLVKSGLEAGDRIIVEGLQKVRAGQPARVTPTDVAAQ